MIALSARNGVSGSPGNASLIGSKPHFSRYLLMLALASCSTVSRVSKPIAVQSMARADPIS